jgi:hypothetical protein
LHKKLLHCIFQHYDPKKECVTLGTGERFSLYPYDVHNIMGLKDKGTLVVLDEQITLLTFQWSFRNKLISIGNMSSGMVRCYKEGRISSSLEACLRK